MISDEIYECIDRIKEWQKEFPEVYKKEEEEIHLTLRYMYELARLLAAHPDSPFTKHKEDA